MLIDYQARLAEFVESINKQSFEWGVTDCVALTLKAMTIMTGEHEHEELISWHNAKEAAEVFKNDINPENYLKQIDASIINIKQGTTGDIVTGIESKLRLPATGVIIGLQVVSSSIEHGVYTAPLDYEVLEKHQRTLWRL